MRSSILGVLSFLLSGCAFISETDSNKRQDPDGDGTIWLEDCSEGNSEVSKSIWYEDADGDGEGNPESILESCEEPEGNWVDNKTDCDDENSTVNLSADEVCDGLDNDCDDAIDEEDDIVQSSQNHFLQDADGDGYPLEGTDIWTCDAQIEGYIRIDDGNIPEYDCDDVNSEISPADSDGDNFSLCDDVPDCDDENAEKNPEKMEVCDAIDNNCDGIIDENLPTTHYLDLDGDGYGNGEQGVCVPEGTEPPTGYVSDSDDCDDSLESGLSVYPQAEETCDTIDNDCDGEIDEDVQIIRYYDNDGDGYGSDSNMYVGCEEPSDPKYVTASGDCQDDGTLDLDGDQILDHSLINPDANEICYDFEDNDCNGLTDEVENNNWNEDLFVSLGEGAPKVYYLDSDGDGYGTVAESGRVYSCFNPSASLGLNYVNEEDYGDCDDNDASIHPGFYESPPVVDDLGCDCATQTMECTYDLSQDNDADGVDDLGCDSSTLTKSCTPDLTCLGCIQDVDGDGYGDSFTDGISAFAPEGLLAGTDCNDNDDTVNSTKPEICDGLDNNCDGELSEEESDGDGDGFIFCEIDGNGWDGDSMVATGDCDDTPVTTDSEGNVIDQGGAQTYPGAAESEANPLICYRDNDGDGYGDVLATGDVVGGTDCDDSNATSFPNANELCDGIITSCGGSLPDDEIDDDGDGFVECAIEESGWLGADDVGGGDCDDTPATTDDDGNIIDVGGTKTYPGAAENETDLITDGICVSDNDGDGYAPIEVGGLDCDDNDPTFGPLENESDPNACYLDADGDGYGEIHIDNLPSEAPEGLVPGTDCDDSYTTGEFIHPLPNEADPTLCYEDFDGDGYGDSFELSPDDLPEGASPGTDCNDDDEHIYPNATELCDGVNTSCATLLPDDEVDDDGDGYVECVIDEGGWFGTDNVLGGLDCDDSNAFYTPLENESDPNACYYDSDRDGYGDDLQFSMPSDSPQNLASGTDCNDEDVDISPAATEVNCDNVDNDCDGIDENSNCLIDNDGDGHASIANGGLDCDDNNAFYAPLENESDPNACYYDSDRDGYGDDLQSSMPSDSPQNLASGTDCNDNDQMISPSATEIACDGVDNDCDPTTVDSEGVADCPDKGDVGGEGISQP